jgi:hypothetical protein
MSKISRRAALARILFAGGAVAGAGFGVFRRFARHPAAVAVPPIATPPAEAKPGPLDPRALATLLAATEAIIGLPIEPNHYANFLRWRSENLAGYRSLCERFAAALEQAALESGRRAFAQCDPATRLQLVDVVTARAGALRIAFESVRRQLLVLFSRTDAYIAFGYDSWAGVPRGFDAYRSAPSRAPRQ